MREIKFRAWCLVRNEMIENVIIDSGSNQPMEWPANGYPVDIRGIPMQFTGLQDRNDVEIYDRDIVSDGHFIWEVYFEDGCFRCALKSHYNKVIDQNLLYKILRARSAAKMPVEVIGNIHENPELLEQSDEN